MNIGYMIQLCQSWIQNAKARPSLRESVEVARISRNTMRSSLAWVIPTSWRPMKMSEDKQSVVCAAIHGHLLMVWGAPYTFFLTITIKILD